MAVNYGKGAKKKAIQLHSKVVRTRAGFVCERCGIKRGDIRDTGSKVAIQAAHIVSRRYNATVTDERNGFALCAKCHWYLDNWHLEFAAFVEEKHGDFRVYNELKSKVEFGYVPDWDEEIERLTELLEHYESVGGVPG